MFSLLAVNPFLSLSLIILERNPRKMFSLRKFPSQKKRRSKKNIFWIEILPRFVFYVHFQWRNVLYVRLISITFNMIPFSFCRRPSANFTHITTTASSLCVFMFFMRESKAYSSEPKQPALARTFNYYSNEILSQWQQASKLVGGTTRGSTLKIMLKTWFHAQQHSGIDTTWCSFSSPFFLFILLESNVDDINY